MIARGRDVRPSIACRMTTIGWEQRSRGIRICVTWEADVIILDLGAGYEGFRMRTGGGVRLDGGF